MNVGEALVVCTVLVLEVYRPDFRKFLLWAVGVGVALCTLAAGIWWSRSAYQNYVATKHRVAADTCVKRLTGIDPNTNPDTLPANWFATVDTCEKNPETALAVPEYGSVIEIRGGETLKVVPPKPRKTNAGQLDLTGGMIPIVYLGHNQKFFLACGVFGEHGGFPTITDSTATCP